MSFRRSNSVFLAAALLVPAVFGVAQDRPPAPPGPEAKPPVGHAKPARGEAFRQGSPGPQKDAPPRKDNQEERRFGPGERPGMRPPFPGERPGMRPPFPFGRGPGDRERMGPRRPPFPPWFEDLAKMSPEDRKRALEENPHFRNLPPERQENVRRRLEDFSSISPERRARMKEHWEVMNSLSPEGREKIREVFPRWRSLPEDRQKEIREEFRSLRAKTAAERERRFGDPEFQKTFSPVEQQLLKDLAALLR